MLYIQAILIMMAICGLIYLALRLARPDRVRTIASIVLCVQGVLLALMSFSTVFLLADNGNNLGARDYYYNAATGVSSFEYLGEGFELVSGEGLPEASCETIWDATTRMVEFYGFFPRAVAYTWHEPGANLDFRALTVMVIAACALDVIFMGIFGFLLGRADKDKPSWRQVFPIRSVSLVLIELAALLVETVGFFLIIFIWGIVELFLSGPTLGWGQVLSTIFAFIFVMGIVCGGGSKVILVIFDD